MALALSTFSEVLHQIKLTDSPPWTSQTELSQRPFPAFGVFRLFQVTTPLPLKPHYRFFFSFFFASSYASRSAKRCKGSSSITPASAKTSFSEKPTWIRARGRERSGTDVHVVPAAGAFPARQNGAKHAYWESVSIVSLTQIIAHC